MNASIYIGIAIAVLSIAGLAVYSGTKVKNTKFRSNSSIIVSGIILGTLVGGGSTVGTAQLAYNYGVSAWWFTLGGGLACLILALFYVKPLRRQKSQTLVGMIEDEYGAKAGMLASILNSVGTFINIISQLLAASAVVLVVWPGMNIITTVTIAAFFMALYVVFGGTKGAGMVGILKLALLYLTMVVCGVIAFRFIGGTGQLVDLVNGYRAETGVNYFSLISRGAGKDIGACFSLIFGVLTTQTYAQGVLSGKTDQAARRGALISVCMGPPIGVCGIMVGLYMRSVTDPATFPVKTALTEFILKYSGVPDVLAGIMLGALFIASVGTGAGLALGVSNVINRDIIKKITHKFDDVKVSSILDKVLIVAILACGVSLSTGSLGDTILNFSYISMGLRGATVFAPHVCLLFGRKKVDPKYAIWSIVLGPVIVLVIGVIPFTKALLNGLDPLFPGMAVTILIMLVGYLKGTDKEPGQLNPGPGPDQNT